MRDILRGALVAGLAFVAAACDGQSDTTTAGPATPVNATTVIADKRWLDVNDRAAPEHWLASREAAMDLSPSASEVAVFRDLLARADRRYSETPRMIANRAVQLEEMLAARGIRESARLVIEGLAALGGDDERRRGFGETGQHYFNVRVTGVSREQALRLLQEAEHGTR